MNRRLTALASIVILALCGSLFAQQKPAEAQGPKVKISQLSVSGSIEGANITFTVEFDAAVEQPNSEIPLIVGQVSLASLEQPKEGYTLRYDSAGNTYYMGWRTKGAHHVKASFAAKALSVPATPGAKQAQSPAPAPAPEWLEATFSLPAAQVRQLDVTCDRTDLEVQFPDAMRVQRNQKDGKLVLSAILGPGKPFTVRFKPQIQKMDAKLVFSSQANVIAAVSAATVRVDSLLVLDISQGSLGEIKLKLPAGLSVTQVRGQFIQDWAVVEPAAGGKEPRTLRVTLLRPQEKLYALQVLGEASVAALPSDFAVPVIEPIGALRASGQIAVGTGSAIQVQVTTAGGLTQIDARAFPKAALDTAHPRVIPETKAFFYTFATSPYDLALHLDNVTPTYDAQYRQTITVKDEDFTIDADITLDVREAPLRELVIDCPAGFQVASVTGALVSDFRTERGAAASRPAATRPAQPSKVRVQFKQPVLGKTNIALRMELGRGPLDETQNVDAIRIAGAKTQRGFLAVAGEDGLQMEVSKADNLREVNVASLEVIPPEARMAYRFRQGDWTLSILAHKKPASIRTESFHLLSIGEGRVYGSVAVSYFITGSPVDKLRFTLPASLKNVQFIGRDVRRVDHDDTVYTVQLQRRVIGDYNLGLTFEMPYEDGGSILAGAVQCDQVETQTGYIVVTSHLNLDLEQPASARPDKAILAISRQEVPGNYRLLATAPILKTYKYDNAPHTVTLAVKAHQRVDVIPAVIEVMDAKTLLTLREDNQTESVTTIRYKIKNTSSQFLTLKMPAGATVWSVSLLERREDGTPVATRCDASTDDKLGLMIPLPRYRNPNDPITVEVEYAQTHGKPGAWSSQLSLAAPQSPVPATFANWRVDVPGGYAATPGDGGDMVPGSTQRRPVGFASVLSDVGRAWGWAFTSGVDPTAMTVAVVAILAFLVTIALLFRRALPETVIGLAIVVLLIVGAVATRAPSFQQQLSATQPATSLEFNQVVNLQGQASPAISIVTVPAWREHLPVATAIWVPAAIVVLAILGLLVRRLRKVCTAAALAAVAMGAASISPLVVPLGHALTWGAPLLVGIAMASGGMLRLLAHMRAKPAVAALLLVGMAVMASGCASQPISNYISDDPVISRADYKLTVEKDSMVVDCNLKASAPRAADFVLMGQSAVLLSQASPQKNVSIELVDGMHHLKIKEAGVYDLQLQFLYPLAAPDINRESRFGLPMPLALSNSVQLTVPEGDIEIASPTALRCTQEELAAPAAATRPSAASNPAPKTVATAIMPPGRSIDFVWKPRPRQPQREETRFYSQVTSVACFDAPLVSMVHDIRLQVAQGELKQFRITVPSNVVVTGVTGQSIGAWRFDPAANEVEVRFAAPVTGEYSMQLVAQAAVTAVPYQFEIKPIVIAESQRQRTLVGLVNTADVFVDANSKAQAINVDDFARDAASLIGQTTAAQRTPACAYRLEAGDSVSVRADAVLPELRATETAVFNVEDDKLTYNGRLDVQIDKAGMFAIKLMVPAAYDIDALQAAQLSHWDETISGDIRTVTVHFARKTMGPVQLSLAMSCPIAQLPPELSVPRVELAGSLMHQGQMLVRCERGVQLRVSDRQGVTDANPLEAGVRETGALAFKLLKPDWSVKLETQVIEPLINVDALHVAKVSDGVVQHQDYLRYRLYHAGVKALTLQLPADAQVVTITGPDIARREDLKNGKWRIELAKKLFDDPYSLRVSYQTGFDRDAGNVTILPVQAVGADQQRGHVAVYTTERVELLPASVDPSLQKAEARTVQARDFGAGDLSDAAFCYAASNASWTIKMQATRHAESKQVEAEVREVDIGTVVTESGQSITRVSLAMTVGSKRYLQCRLPEGARLWSLLVNDRAAVPSRQTAGGHEELLVPLAQSAAQALNVNVDLVYVQAGDLKEWMGRRDFQGPRFDLPLKKIRWRLYLPESYSYGDFEGAMSPESLPPGQPAVAQYNLAQYERSVRKLNISRNKQAKDYLEIAQQFAQEGRQYGARELLQQARTFSLSDSSLNEDINNKLDSLLHQQAKVGLVGSRDRLRQQAPGAANASTGAELGDRFNQQQAEQIESGLSAADTENLDLISRRMIETQAAAAGTPVQLLVELPQRGKMLEFTRPLLVKPDSPLELSFEAKPRLADRLPSGWLWAVALFLAILGILYVKGPLGRSLGRMRTRLAKPAVRDDQQPVSAADLGIAAEEKK